jgi:hypothetical protein
MSMRIGRILVYSICGLAMLAMSARASGEPGSTGSLEIRKVKHVIDGDGKVWLSIQFANHGTKTVSVSAISPGRLGPWVKVDQSVEAGAAMKTLMNIARDEPTTVWISTSEGLCKFDLPARN